jgi:hypothetical protein
MRLATIALPTALIRSAHSSATASWTQPGANGTVWTNVSSVAQTSLSSLGAQVGLSTTGPGFSSARSSSTSKFSSNDLHFSSSSNYSDAGLVNGGAKSRPPSVAASTDRGHSSKPLLALSSSDVTEHFDASRDRSTLLTSSAEPANSTLSICTIGCNQRSSTLGIWHNNVTITTPPQSLSTPSFPSNFSAIEFSIYSSVYLSGFTVYAPDSLSYAACYSDYILWTISSELALFEYLTDTSSLVYFTESLTYSSAFPTYPTSGLSPYTLCDGTPRVDQRPITTTTLWSFTLTIPGPDPHLFSPPPPPNCTIDPYGCLWLIRNTNINNETMGWLFEMEICDWYLDSLPADDTCVIQGGPISMLYWPVTTVDGDLCKGNGSTVPGTRSGDGPNTVVTLGTVSATGELRSRPATVLTCAIDTD